MLTPPASGRGVVVHATGRTLSVSRLDLSTQVDRRSARVSAPHHVAFGETLAQRALLIAAGAGGEALAAEADAVTAALLDLIESDVAPALIVLDRIDLSIALAVLVARTLRERGPALVVLDSLHFALAASSHTLTLEADARLILTGPRLAGLANVTGGGALAFESAAREAANDAVTLSSRDRDRLDGNEGAGTRAAMEILIRLAALHDVGHLVDVLGVHLGESVPGGETAGQGSQTALSRLAALGARVAVPTTFDGAAGETRSTALAAFGAVRERSPTLPDGGGAWLRLEDGDGALWYEVPEWFGLCAALTGRAPMIRAAVSPAS